VIVHIERRSKAGVAPVGDERNATARVPAPGIRPSDLEGIELRHAIPGRIRLRIRAIKGEPRLSREVQKQLAGLRVIRRVEANPVTGSVLVLYDPADSAAIAQLGRMIIPGLDLDAMAGAHGAAEQSGTGAVPARRAIADFARSLNRKVEDATGCAVDLKLLVPASLVVGGLIRLIASRRIPSPSWYDFLWFAFGTYFTLNRAEGDEGPAEPANARPEAADAADDPVGMAAASP
jgi:Heavy metal associated domain 2